MSLHPGSRGGGPRHSASPKETAHMNLRYSPSLRAAIYALRGGFLVRPIMIVALLGTGGALLSEWEERFPGIRALIPQTLFPSQADPQVAQVILTIIATSTMTVVSIVFAILLMTLTLASTQFSPRLLVSFVRDRVTQWTLGLFLGTFSYCIAALPAARMLPTPFAPVVTTLGAMMLAPLCVGMLIYFIFHISNAISVNNIVDRLRRETELVIDELMPERRRPMHPPEPAGVFSHRAQRNHSQSSIGLYSLCGHPAAACAGQGVSRLHAARASGGTFHSRGRRIDPFLAG